jgi:hypothetical protein
MPIETATKLFNNGFKAVYHKPGLLELDRRLPESRS